MEKHSLVDMVQSQVIAAISSEELIEQAIESNVNIAFLLTGDIFTLKEYVRRLQQAGMYVFIHLEFIEGISYHKSAIKYITEEWKPEGIITTRSQVIKTAKEAGLITIQRIFLLDHSAMNKGIEMAKSCKPDAIEILPGLMPRVIYEMTELTNIPLIAGGLIREKKEILEALQAGALATSVGESALWNLGI